MEPTTHYRPTEEHEYMDEQMTNFFRDKLVEEGKELDRLIVEQTAVVTQKNSQTDLLDQAGVEVERNLGNANRTRNLIKLESVKKALALISSGDYGWCIDPQCGEEIGVRRLLINPALQHCVDCADLQEEINRRR